MKRSIKMSNTALLLFTTAAAAAGLVHCSDDTSSNGSTNRDSGAPTADSGGPQGEGDTPVDDGVNGPASGATNPNVHQKGTAANGQAVFRNETFGNEGFWTDAVKLPQGFVAAGVTPVMALKLGLSVDVDALDPATKTAVAAEIAAMGTTGPLLNDPATTVKLINANAVIGVVVKEYGGDPAKLDTRRSNVRSARSGCWMAPSSHDVAYERAPFRQWPNGALFVDFLERRRLLVANGCSVAKSLSRCRARPCGMPPRG